MNSSKFVEIVANHSLKIFVKEPQNIKKATQYHKARKLLLELLHEEGYTHLVAYQAHQISKLLLQNPENFYGDNSIETEIFFIDEQSEENELETITELIWLHAFRLDELNQASIYEKKYQKKLPIDLVSPIVHLENQKNEIEELIAKEKKKLDLNDYDDDSNSDSIDDDDDVVTVHGYNCGCEPDSDADDEVKYTQLKKDIEDLEDSEEEDSEEEDNEEDDYRGNCQCTSDNKQLCKKCKKLCNNIINESVKNLRDLRKQQAMDDQNEIDSMTKTLFKRPNLTDDKVLTKHEQFTQKMKMKNVFKELHNKFTEGMNEYVKQYNLNYFKQYNEFKDQQLVALHNEFTRLQQEYEVEQIMDTQTKKEDLLKELVNVIPKKDDDVDNAQELVEVIVQQPAEVVVETPVAPVHTPLQHTADELTKLFEQFIANNPDKIRELLHKTEEEYVSV